MIRSELYTKHLNEISRLVEKLDDTLDRLPCFEDETMEENEIRSAIYRAAEKLNDAKNAIEHFTKPVKEGTLRENDMGKFEIDYINGGSSYPLSCGSSLEVYLQEDTEKFIEEGSHPGRVEATNG
ncbi:MAG: DUF5348 domain-containing protein, partial [Achromobacter sp.]|uniref:DUF5348 domain-containing protein n=1 Tax=Achromobacter sp. TaxID=134375 RepID=UPI001ACB2866